MGSWVPEMHDPIFTPGFHPMTDGVPWIGEGFAKTLAQSRFGTPCRFGLIDRAGRSASDRQEQQADKSDLHRSNVPQKRHPFHP